MYTIKDLQKRVFNLNFNSSDELFNNVCIEVFQFQYNHNTFYKSYCDAINKTPSSISHYTQIPFLPIEFFKNNLINSQALTENAICFTSSGTTNQITSKHWINDVSIYEESFIKGFELFYGPITDYCILALLPNYLERTGSSLVYMFNKLIQLSQHQLSNFYLNNLNDLLITTQKLKQENKKTLLLGVTYALLDFVELNPNLGTNFIVMETGGMKGKRKEMIKEELYSILKEKLHVSEIHSEYGMTELLSQAYSYNNGKYKCVPWMKVLIREINDPFNYTDNQKKGGVNIIDLANIESCSFIETKDIGKIISDNEFEIHGRFDNSDMRGCNLMI